MDRSVMIFTPTFLIDGKEKISQATRRSIQALRWQGTKDWIIGLKNPYQSGGVNVLAQYIEGREIFLAGDYEALLTVEHDIIVGSETLERLWSVMFPEGEIELKCDVVYGIYMLRHGLSQMNAWRMEGSVTPGVSFSNYPEDLERMLERRDVLRVSGIGFGCTLFRREVLENVSFHAAREDKCPIPDIPFATDCLRHGYVQGAHFGARCGHVDHNGTVLFPNLGRVNEMLRVKILISVNVDTGKATQHYMAGETVAMEEEQARMLEAGGYLRVIEKISQPAVKILNKPTSSPRSVK